MFTSKTIIPFLFIFFIMACHNKKNKNNAEQSDSSNHAVISKEKLFQDFKAEGLQSWIKNMKEKYPHFSVRHLDTAEKQHIPNSSKKYSLEDWQAFQSSFIRSPNKKWALDLKSYNHWMNDSTQKPESGSPDNALNLVHLSQQTKTQLLFTGPGTTFQKAVWINDSIALITGESDANIQNKMQPIIWKVNIRSGTITEFTYSADTLNSSF